MHSLFVIYPGSPLPLDSGGAIRYWNLLLSLRELGDVDVGHPEPKVFAASSYGRERPMMCSL